MNRARLLDGKSPHPVEGTAHIDESSIVFQDAQAQPTVLAVANIQSVEIVGGAVHVTFRADTSLTATPLLVVDNIGFAGILNDTRGRRATSGWDALKIAIARTRLRVWIIAALIVIPLAYFAITRGIVLGHVFISVEQEEELGEAVYGQLKSSLPTCDTPQLQASIQSLVDALADPQSEYSYQVTIHKSKEANAFALPGGRIVLLSGLFDLFDSPEGLAGVLAHEIAHVDRRHGVKHLLRSIGTIAFMSLAFGGGVEQLEILETMAELGSFVLIFKHSRDAELEADTVAVETLNRHGLSVKGLVGFFRTIEKKYGVGGAELALAWMSTHPATGNRIRRLEQLDQSSHESTSSLTPILNELAEHWSSACP